MKPRLPLLFVGFLCASSALGQEQVLVCQRDQNGECVWVKDDARQPVLPPVASVPSRQGFEQWYRPRAFDRTQSSQATVQISPTPGLDPTQPAEILGAGYAQYDWQVVSAEFDPNLGKPGGCATSPARARYHFVAAMESGDLNKVMAIYDWHDKTEAQATPLIDRLGAIPRSGQWEQAVPSASMGGDEGLTPRALDRWRWQADGQSFYFKMIQQSGCWSIAFTDSPAEGDGSFIAPLGAIPSDAHPVDLHQVSPGVVEF